MSVTITVSDEVAQHHSLTDRQFTQKYNMNFEAFERQQLTKQHGYTWEVESDAIDWETAVDGIRTMQRQLTALTRAGKNDDH